MTTDAVTKGLARFRIAEATTQILFKPEYNVVMVDFGVPVHGEKLALDEDPVIRFHVPRKLSEQELKKAGIQALPATFGEFAVDVVEGTYRPYRGARVRRRIRDAWRGRCDTLCGGVSISDERHVSAGTLGGIVIDRETQRPMILSNWHVLAAWGGALRGQAIYQPGRLDGGSPEDLVARLERHALDSGLDAAVAFLEDARPWVNNQLGVGPVTGVVQPDLRMRVVKSGRSTRRTTGVVTGIGGVARLPYGDRFRKVRRTIRTIVAIDLRDPSDGGTSPPLSSGGDSGGWWLTEDTREVVALHFAGTNIPERALGVRMTAIEEALNISVAL